MARTLAFLHTTHVLIPVFAKLAKEMLPGVEVFHMVDESLLRSTLAAGQLTKGTTRRVVRMIESAREGGADVVMVTCSSIGPAVTIARELVDCPVLRVDEPMAEAAVRMGTRIGVAATVQTTLAPTIALLEQTAARAGRRIQLVPRLCEGAFAAILAGEVERHDKLVSDALLELTGEVDVIVLAQASMARVVAAMPASAVPILASPPLAVTRAREVLSGLTD